MTTYPIVPPADGEVISEQWIADVTDSINNSVALTPVQSLDSAVTDGNTTSTSYTNSLTTTTFRGIAFTAPATGMVLVSGASSGRNSAGNFAFLEFEVRAGSTIGSGTLIRASDDNSSSSFQSDSTNQQGPLTIPATLVSGLTPGQVYHASLTYRANAGTATYNRRKITVTPV